MSWSDRYTTNEMNNIISNLLDIVSSMVEDWYNCDMNIHNKDEIVEYFTNFGFHKDEIESWYEWVEK